MDRRDSKKSGSKQRQKDKSGKKSEEIEDDRKGKSSGLIRTKFPCREIYRPPSMRKQRTNSTGSSHDLNNFGNTGNNCGAPQQISPIARPGNGTNSSRSTFNVHAKEFQFSLLDSPQQQQQHGNYTQSGPYYSNRHHHQQNTNSDYFNTQNEVKSSPILTSGGCYPLQQSKSSGTVNANNNFYQLWQQQQVVPSEMPLTVSKPRNQSGILMESKGSMEQSSKTLNENEGHNLYRRHVPIQQSKSSGNISLRQANDNLNGGMGLQHSSTCGPKTVRFDFQEPRTTPLEINHKVTRDFNSEFSSGQGLPMDRFSRMKKDLEFTEQSFASLQIDGEAQAIVRGNSHQDIGNMKQMSNTISSPQLNSKFRHIPSQPPPPPLQLQKSRTTFYMDGNSCGYNANNGRTNVVPPNYDESKEVKEGRSNMIRRSRSFGIAPTKSTVNPNPLQQSSSTTFIAPPPLTITELTTSPDFNVTIWPKSIQESITAVMTTSADRVPVRSRIEMVTKIFSVILREYEKSTFTNGQKVNGNDTINNCETPDNVDGVKDIVFKDCEGNVDQKNGNGARNSHDISADLTSSAVNIFVHLIQREKDRTVMESVLNTCFATFQRLQRLYNKNGPPNSPETCSREKINSSSVTFKWIAFLQFLSAMYAKIKVFRLQKSQQPGMKGMEELNFTLLALLCDSCLINLRSPLFQTSETMDPLFNIMTSIGRDMEMTFPMKMKQILAAVRDALLGIRPFSEADEPPSPNIKKTLMQLIELHAANWHLSSSAVRYYYSNPG